jgi:hypothetical protein
VLPLCFRSPFELCPGDAIVVFAVGEPERCAVLDDALDWASRLCTVGDGTPDHGAGF